MVRIVAVLAASLTLSACHHGPSNEAIRQAVIDRLKQPGLGLNMAAMDLNLTSVEMAGSEADATVSLTLKEAKDAPGMTVKYHLREEGGKWVVVGLAENGTSPHAGAPAAGGNPHAGGVPDAGSAARMPSPGDLPPAGTGK